MELRRKLPHVVGEVEGVNEGSTDGTVVGIELGTDVGKYDWRGRRCQLELMYK